MPLFSVIIPSYNRADLIALTLDSVLKQDYSDFEIVVADDGSRDNTADIVRGYAQRDPRVKLHVQANKGEGAARNLAIRNATGEYLAFLDSDDTFFPWTLRTYARCIEQFNRPASIAGMWFSFHADAELSAATEAPFSADAYPDALAYWGKRNDTFPPSCCAMRRDVVNRIGGFLERHINGVDLDLWLRVADAPGFVRLHAPVVAGRREHASNISGNKEMMIASANNLIDRERSGVYAGGPQRQRERLEFMLFHVRWIMVECIRAGRQRAGWDLYRTCFAWHVRLGRMRALFGFPALSLSRLLRGAPR